MFVVSMAPDGYCESVPKAISGLLHGRKDHRVCASARATYGKVVRMGGKGWKFASKCTAGMEGSIYENASTAKTHKWRYSRRIKYEP